MPLFYKGVPANTFHSQVDFRLNGLAPRAPGGGRGIDEMIRHICHGTAVSAFISLTRSYTVAEEYAYSGRTAPSRVHPGLVYEVQIDDPPPPGVEVIDPVARIAGANHNPLSTHSYHHDGGQNVLLGIANPTTMGHLLRLPVKDPPMSGRTPRGPFISRELEAIVRALRDSEVIVAGNLPARCFIVRHEIF